MSFTGRKTMQEHWNECARLVEQLGVPEIIKMVPQRFPEWTAHQQEMMIGETQFADSWVHAGRITYELTHSMAALLVLTSAADISRLPHEAFAIKVPREFLPMEGSWSSSDSWIAVAKRGDGIAIFAIPDSDTTAVSMTHYFDSVSGDDLERSLSAGKEKHRRTTQLTRRLAANTIAYILEHRDCVTARRQGKIGEAPTPVTYEVRPPREIAINKDFRDAAKAAVCATSFIGIRRALQHFVRGHWRNQPVGPNRSERRYTWVKPHRRGDESLGSVVARLERLYISDASETP